MKDKLLPLKEASSLVSDGDAVAMTTVAVDGAPMAFLREIIRNGARELKAVGVTGGGLNIDLLIGAGVVSTVEICHSAMGSYGLSPNFKRKVEAGLFHPTDNT